MKEQLRKEFLKSRRAMRQDIVEKRSRKITERLSKLPHFREARTIMFYVDHDNEVQTRELMRSCFEQKRVIVPKVRGEEIICCEISSFDELRPGAYNILEPEEESVIRIEDIDLILVPGTAFDRKKHRLGYGFGYYDKLLKQAKGHKIGLAYGFQIIKNIPEDDWDIELDEIITDNNGEKQIGGAK